jgi:hypothetical protein
MKKRIVINNRRARLLAMSLALGAGMTILGGAVKLQTELEKSGRWATEWDIRLDGVPADAKPTIERKQKDNLVVVTVPKSPALAGTRPLFTPAPWIVPLDAWDRDVL